MIFKKSVGIAALFAAAIFSAQPVFADCTPPECYGASAAGTWNTWDGIAHVAIGVAWNLPNNGVAQREALNQCHSDGGMNCAVVGYFSNGGCGYIASGIRGEEVKWAASSSESGAYNNCSSGGFSCDSPIGGCTAGE